MPVGQKSYAKDDTVETQLNRYLQADSTTQMTCEIDDESLQIYQEQSEKFVSTFEARYWALNKIAQALKLTLLAKYPFEVVAIVAPSIDASIFPIFSSVVLNELSILPALAGLNLSTLLILDDASKYDDYAKAAIEREKLIESIIPDVKNDFSKFERQARICDLNGDLKKIKATTHEILTRDRSLMSYQWEQQMDMQVKLTSYAIQYKIHQARLKYIDMD